MSTKTASLLEVSIAEQEARNSAALAAIRARADDIAETHKLIVQLSSRGANVRAIIDTQPIGAQALCRITLWISATRVQWAEIELWLSVADIAITRTPMLDAGEVIVYELALRRQKLQLNVALHDPRPPRFRFVPDQLPAAA